MAAAAPPPTQVIDTNSPDLKPSPTGLPPGPHQYRDWTAAQIRQVYVDYFVKAHEHTFVPSSGVVPLNDPTLLFTNAGMNQYKPIFLGTVEPSSEMAKWKRAANSQKCIRAGGKHNDLEDVGKDTYHHTFFEMLGNWSFGDYFKKEAIDWSWDCLTRVFGIPADRLYVTYFGGGDGVPADEETRDLWLRYLPKERVMAFGKKDNFWEMGDTGPCGPCTEIHYDRVGGRDASALVNADVADVMEVWNNVFIQFNREADGSLRQLPAKHVDTGMGFERLTAVVQGKSSNYDTDAFTPIFAAIEQLGPKPGVYTGKLGADDVGAKDMAYRVLADHIRTLTFAITDGGQPDRVGRGYVLRRILRRAVRYGQDVLGLQPGFLSGLVSVVVDYMGDFFPELRRAGNAERVAKIIHEEEMSFNKTLDSGIRRFKAFIEESPEAKTAKIVTGEIAFRLYDTFGFPVDLTRLMAEERGLTVDEAGFNKCMAQQQARSKEAAAEAAGVEVFALTAEAIAALKDRGVPRTDDAAKYAPGELAADVHALWGGAGWVETLGGAAATEGMFGVVLDRTNFYAEQGGQVFDTGVLRVGAHELAVTNCQVFNGYVVHVVRALPAGVALSAAPAARTHVAAVVDVDRRAPIMRNHTGTHMLNFALREVLGEGIDQKGSLVAPDRLRFDIGYGKSMTADECAKVDALMQDLVRRELPVYAKSVTLAQAKPVNGLRAVFGEVYPDPVRVISIGADVDALLADPASAKWRGYSVEFCGGTHLSNTRELLAFAFTREESLAKGVRRLTAVTGLEAQEAWDNAELWGDKLTVLEGIKDIKDLAEKYKEASADFGPVALPAHVKEALRLRMEAVGKKAAAAGKAWVVVNGVGAGADGKAIAAAFATAQKKHGGLSLLMVGSGGEKAIVMAQTTAGVDAAAWVAAVAGKLGLKSGGKGVRAQGAGKAANEDFDGAIAVASTWAESNFGGKA